jgi:hypothetical protein
MATGNSVAGTQVSFVLGLIVETSDRCHVNKSQTKEFRDSARSQYVFSKGTKAQIKRLGINSPQSLETSYATTKAKEKHNKRRTSNYIMKSEPRQKQKKEVNIVKISATIHCRYQDQQACQNLALLKVRRGRS